VIEPEYSIECLPGVDESKKEEKRVRKKATGNVVLFACP